jgi:hypothetical protein
MTRPPNPWGCTYHRNGDVTLWDVYRQQLDRLRADGISDTILATLGPDERDKIAAHRWRHYGTSHPDDEAGR